jgi:hypothetical protein
MKVSNFNEELRFAEAGIKVSEDVDSNQRRAATSRQGIMRVLTSYEVILTENKRSLSHQTSVLEFFQSSSRILPLPICCCTLEMIIQGTCCGSRGNARFLNYFLSSYFMWFIPEV